MTGDDYVAAWRAYDPELPAVLPPHLSEWRMALTWTSLHGHDGLACWVQETPAVDPDRGWPKRATCRCGWHGPDRQLESAAGIDLAHHAWPGWETQRQEPYPEGDAVNRYASGTQRVIRSNVCGSWPSPALCRGVFPLAGFLLVVCICPAHWNVEEARARGEAERASQAEWLARDAERWRNGHRPERAVRPTQGSLFLMDHLEQKENRDG